MTRSTLRDGDQLNSGEHLESDDGRFRVRLEENGELVAYAYTPARGIQRFWRNGVLAGESATARFEFAQHPISLGPPSSPALSVYNASGIRVWSSIAHAHYPRHLWTPHACEMQKDGNLVVYALSLNHPGIFRSPWASNTWRRWTQESATVPNIPVVTLPVGTLAIGDGVGNADIINLSSTPYGIECGTAFEIIEPNAPPLPIAITGTLEISIITYDFGDLRGPDGRRPYISLDAAEAVPAPPRGVRLTIDLLNGPRLRLTGFSKSTVEAGVFLYSRPVSTSLDFVVGDVLHDVESSFPAGNAEQSGEREPPVTRVLKS